MESLHEPGLHGRSTTANAASPSNRQNCGAPCSPPNSGALPTGALVGLSFFAQMYLFLSVDVSVAVPSGSLPGPFAGNKIGQLRCYLTRTTQALTTAWVVHHLTIMGAGVGLAAYSASKEASRSPALRRGFDF
jgi:hypothetical protein